MAIKTVFFTQANPNTYVSNLIVGYLTTMMMMMMEVNILKPKATKCIKCSTKCTECTKCPLSALSAALSTQWAIFNTEC